VALLAALGMGLSVGNAAALPLKGGSMKVFAASRCSGATVVTTAATGKFIFWADSIRITSPPACAGLPYVLTAYSSTGGVVATASGSLAAAGPTTVDVVSPNWYVYSNVAGVALTIGTWGVRTSWTG